MSTIEIIAFVVSLLGIWLATRSHITTWPLQITGSLLYVYLFLSVNLFGESILQFVYAAIAAYGWFRWRKGSAGSTLVISRLTKRDWIILNCVGIACTLLVATFQVHFLPTDVPYLDSTVFIFGLIAQWMQAQKKIENWIYWIVLDLISAGIYWSKGLELTAVLYLILTGLAVWGWMQWRKEA